jgi:hypothetical protein
MLRIVCAWCGRTISDPQSDQYSLDCQTSHGICPRCLEENLAVLEQVKPATEVAGAEPDHGGDHGGEG